MVTKNISGLGYCLLQLWLGLDAHQIDLTNVILCVSFNL
jgi:hypothetical protein